MQHIRVPNPKANADSWAKFWDSWTKIVRKGNTTGMKY